MRVTVNRIMNASEESAVINIFKRTDQIDVPADWESDFIVTSQALSRHVWDICSVPGTSQGHGGHKPGPQGAPHHLRKVLPLKKR